MPRDHFNGVDRNLLIHKGKDHWAAQIAEKEAFKYASMQKLQPLSR